MGKRELIALLNLSSWCLVMVEWLFLTVPRGCLQFVIVVFPDHTHLLFFISKYFKLFIGGHVQLYDKKRHKICTYIYNQKMKKVKTMKMVVKHILRSSNKSMLGLSLVSQIRFQYCIYHHLANAIHVNIS